MVRTKDAIWQQWTKVSSGNKHATAKCNYCDLRLQVNVTRFKLHTVMCVNTPDEVKSQYRKSVVSQSIATNKQKAILSVNISRSNESMMPSVPCDLSCDEGDSDSDEGIGVTDSKKVESHDDTRTVSKVATGTLRGPMVHFLDSVSPQDKVVLDDLWSKTCYTNMWSFNSSRNPYLIDFITKLRPSYRLPTPHSLSCGLLDKAFTGAGDIIEQAVSNAPALTLQVDGWSDINRASIVNVAMYAGRPLFLKSIDPGMQRHDARFIANTIVEAMESVPNVDERKFGAVVTDQPSVMTAAWKQIEERKPWVNCYGCGAHAVNLLAGDFRKLNKASAVLDSNKAIAKFFKAHSIPHQLLQRTTKEKCGKPINVVLSSPTRWSTDYFMIRRNLRIRAALLSAAVDDSIAREFKTENNASIKNNILDESFWSNTASVAFLLEPLSTAIQYCEGDNTPISVMKKIWDYIGVRLNEKSLAENGWTNEDIASIAEMVRSQKNLNIQPITLASYALDPRFDSSELDDTEWETAAEFILNFSVTEGCSRTAVLSELTDYRAKSGIPFGMSLTWEAVQTRSCAESPINWWLAYARNTQLCQVAQKLLSFPATAVCACGPAVVF